MKITVRRVAITETDTPLAVVGVFEGEDRPSGVAGAVDAALGGLIAQLIADREISGKPNEVTVIHTQGKLPARRVAVVGLGKRAEFTLDMIRQASASAALKARDLNLVGYATIAHGVGASGLGTEECGRALAEGAVLALYRYEQFKKRTDDTPGDIEEMVMVEPDVRHIAGLEKGARRGEIAANSTNLARDLSNGPPNIITPSYVADKASSLAQELGFACEVLELEDLRRKGMGAILAVGEGSAHPPCLVIMRHQGAPGSAKILAAVGKGITFDSGGLCIKPADAMSNMKHDMSGAAAVLGFVDAAARLKLPANVLGVMALAENLPSSTSYRPGDILTAYNRKTIEVLNTDAEGRLVLSDALAYAVERGASTVIDLATLTGACVVALGTVASGIMGNDEAAIELVRKAGERSGERVWQLPLWKQYGEQIKSDVADVKNIGGRWAGVITAAYFLSNFVGDTPWVHIDIAGTAYIYTSDQPYLAKDRPYLPTGATGVGVRLLLDLVEAWG
ncbi:MAG: leucyl aminopeptidase [Chloroflexi bacterium]|nr:leucyl aminopeptidase [Chloroflexota bacterium]